MLDYLIAEAGIRRLHARYTDAVWRKDFVAFGDCFAEDAEWRIGGTIARGRTACVEHLKGLMPQIRSVLCTFRSPILEVGKGTATGRTYMTEQCVFMDGRTSAPIGTYYEHFIDQGDSWRFKWRLFHLHYRGPADFSGTFLRNPDYGAPPAMPPLDAPTHKHTEIEIRNDGTGETA